jgi:hypothetical protein
MSDNDYAATLAERWAADSSTRSEREAIEGAVREALAKAAEVAETHNPSMSMWDTHDAIRALGAKR